ncbi:hypothetical protein GOBAR_AA02417 [Gossypium barbadense]|uniref:Uncharacterized protein n=1 Tax=Gossypium barbadense TaxID=3634 RepID=A0A2P5YRC8_GOSBA|nr:hypothetical protein GOBAR_AA02417 [Gossypium barbadense]
MEHFEGMGRSRAHNHPPMGHDHLCSRWGLNPYLWHIGHHLGDKVHAELSEVIRSGFESIEKARNYFLVFVCDMEEPKQQGKNMTDNPKTEGQSSGTPSSDNAGEGEQEQQTNPRETRITTAKDKVGNVVKVIRGELESSTRAVALTGRPGVGKTWLAKQITESAVSPEGPFYMSLWTSLSLNQKKDDMSLFQSIARQLSIPNLGSMWEDADDMDDDDKREEVAGKELEAKVRGELKKRYEECKRNEDPEKKHKFLLVVLDCEGEVKSEDYKEIMDQILSPEDYKNDDDKSLTNVLITSRELGNLDSIEKKVQPYSGDEAVAFLNDRVDNHVSLRSKFQILCADIKKRSQVLPAEIIMLAEALNPHCNKASWTEMATDFFAEMTKLRSLNLSALGIKSLPDVFNLTALRRLTLRNCTYLVALPKLANLKDLEVFDVSGSSNLNRLQEKSFQSFHKLRFADFSGTSIEKLPIVQKLENLTILLVRGCVRLSGLRFMKHLHKLKVLDVSGATKIKEIFYDCFTDTDNLKILDLSETDIRFLPESLGKSLCDLKLKGCSKLERLLDTRNLTNLELLDLSDCSSLKAFPNNFFEHLTSLKSLDLSNSQVKSFPSHFDLPYLRHLLLKNCSFESLPESKTFGSFDKLRNLVELDLSGCKSPAEQLPSLEHLTDLEVINLSGYKALSEIDASFEHMSWLQVLNLSETKVSSLPKLSNHSKLRSLILNNCTELRTSPDFDILLKLEELDLRGTCSLTNIKAENLSRLTQLKTLRLSKSAFEATQSYLPNLEQLEVLDLSGEEDVEFVPSLDNLIRLRQLLLGGCSKLNKLPPLNSLSQLEVLDLSGTKVPKIGEEIWNLKLKRLHLPEGAIEEFNSGIRTKKLEHLPLELKLDHCYVSKPSEIPQGDKVPLPRIVVLGVELLKSLKEDSALLERIRHSIFSVRAQPKKEDNYSDSRKHIFSCIYSKIKKLPSKEKDDQCLEIQGFDVFPSDIEVLLEHATYVFLVENGFLKNLSDLKADSLKNIRGCWLERCNNVEESIFVEADLGKWGTLEILWISNLPKLKSLYEEKVQSLSFGSIKHLYIDCCPKLETVFPSWLIAENLETLQITFCDNLKTLFGDNGSNGEKEQTWNPEDTRPTNKKEQRATGSEDKKVHETKSSAKEKVQPKSPINKKEEVQPETLTDKEEQEKAQQPESLPDKEGKDAPKSLPDKEEKEEAQQPESLPDKEEKEEAQQPESLPDKEEKEAPKSLPDKEENEEAQQPESLPDRAANPANMQEEQAVSSADMKKIKLKHLHISYCPMLETVFSSGQVPENLEILRVKHCDELKSVFQPELNDRELPKLSTLHLSDLPAWTSSGYGFKLNESVTKHLRVSHVKGLQDIHPDNASMEATPADEN